MNPSDVELLKTLPLNQQREIEEMAQHLAQAIALMARLRGPNGCPWDREQNHLSLRPYLIEEAYELLEVLDRYHLERDTKQLAKETPHQDSMPSDGQFDARDQRLAEEELGDVLLQVLFHTQLAWERQDFNLGDVARRLTAKLVHRHPHVFGETKVEGSADVLKNWESLKKAEGKKHLLEGLPKSLPSLQRAARIGEKTHRIGFDWKNWTGVWEKVQEEFIELQDALAGDDRTEIAHELGDLFFSLSQLARHLHLEPEQVHRQAIERFEQRFGHLEADCAAAGMEIKEISPERLEAMWQEVKRKLKEL